MKESGFTLTEVLVVLGIFTLTVGTALTLLTTGRYSVDINEAQVRAQENARVAMTKIVGELRQSRLQRAIISESIGWADSLLSGSVINFQIPVRKSDGSFDLTEENLLKWGTEDTEGAYIAYSLNAATGRLMRSTYTAADGSDATGKTIASYIVQLTFTRADIDSNLIDIELVAQAQIGQRRQRQTLCSSIRLRN